MTDQASLLRLGAATLAADVEFIAAVDACAMRHGLNLGLLAVHAAALATCMMMASHLASAQRPTAASARAVRHHAHVVGLPVGGWAMNVSDLRFATSRRITALWVIAYTVDPDTGEAHIYSHTRDPEFADRAFEKKWPTFRLALDGDDDVTGIRITSPGGSCIWRVSNPRGRFEYDAEAIITALLSVGGAR